MTTAQSELSSYFASLSAGSFVNTSA
jgi:hypothetical protein